MATVLAGCNFQCSLKNVAHRVNVPESALVSDHFHTVMTLFQPTTRSFDSQSLNKFSRRRFHFSGENAREIARTHCYAPCQYWYAQRLAQIIEHPRLQLAQWFPIC